MEQFSKHPLPEESRWYEGWLLELLETRIGTQQARDALDRARRTSPAIAESITRARKAKDSWKGKRRHRSAFVVPTYVEIKRLATEPGRKINRLRWARWGEHAEDRLVERLAHDLLKEPEPDRIYKYLHFFGRRAFPLDPSLLLVLARSDDGEIAVAARDVLSHVKYPTVRALALEVMEAEHKPWEAIDLLTHNYEDDDY